MNITINADSLIGESGCISKMRNDIYKLQTQVNCTGIDDYYTREESNDKMNYVHDEICNIKFDVEALKTAMEEVKRSAAEVGEAFRALSAKLAENQKKKDDLEFFEAKIEYSDFLVNAPTYILLSIKSNPFII